MIQERLDDGETPADVLTLAEQTAALTLESAVPEVVFGHNVAGFLPGSDPELRDEWVVVGGGHNDFAEDLPPLLVLACPAGSNPEAARISARRHAVAFLKVFLAGDTTFAPLLAGSEVP